MSFTPIKKIVEDPVRAAHVVRRRYHRYVNHSKRYLKYRFGLKPFEQYWVDPARIKYCTVGRRSQPGDYHADIVCRFEPIGRFYSEIEPVNWGTVKDGNWDEDIIPVSDLLVYRGIHERFIDHRPWAETSLYISHLSRIESGYPSFGQKTRNELLKKLNSIDKLYASIDTQGYKSQKELNKPYNPHAEIIVNIDRNGEPVFNGQGRHRLSIAKLLSVEQIPVTVLVTHPDAPPIDTIF